MVSFGTKDLEWVVNYIRNQKAHHKESTTVERLERITHDEEYEAKADRVSALKRAKSDVGGVCSKTVSGPALKALV